MKSKNKINIVVNGTEYVPEDTFDSAQMNGTRCPECDFITSRVIDTRYTEKYRTTRRRRECMNCGCRWTTIEIIHEDR